MGETLNGDSNNKDLEDADDESNNKNKYFDNPKENADNDNSSEDEQGDEDDATGIKLKLRKIDETEYDDPDDVEEVKDGNFLNYLYSIG